MEIKPRLNEPQAAFLAMPHKFRAFVAGFGSGKTWVGCAGMAQHMWEHPKVNAGYFAPTFPHIRDIFYPTIEEVAFEWGLNTKVKLGDKEVSFYSGKQYRGTAICRSMDDPSTIVGFKIGKALIDEFDLLPTPKAMLAWRKIIARMRYKMDGLKNGVDIATTPEGYKATYEMFVKALRDKQELAANYGLIHASTYDNEANLPEDYIDSLRETYPSQLIEAYLNGKFVNLTSGAVYPEFDRKLNHTNETIKHGEPLHIGMDFNVGRMAAIISVIRDGLPYTVAEITKQRDTPSMIKVLQDRYSAHSITVYPDASGQARKTVNSSESDHKLLREAGFTLLVNYANPAIRDRVMACNGMIMNAEGVRRWKINTDTCPVLTDLMERQAYDNNGDPTKDGTEDPIDAVGYFIAHRYPIASRKPGLAKIIGL